MDPLLPFLLHLPLLALAVTQTLSKVEGGRTPAHSTHTKLVISTAQ